MDCAVVAAPAGVIWLAGCATSPEEDPVLQGKLSDLDSRTSNIERVVQNQSLLSMAQRADQLQNEMSILRGRIEVLENANDTLRKQQRDLYADLDKRLATQSPGAPAGAPLRSRTRGRSGRLQSGLRHPEGRQVSRCDQGIPAVPARAGRKARWRTMPSTGWASPTM